MDFRSFDHRARSVMACAQEEARFLRHSGIRTEHLLLGLWRESEAELEFVGVSRTLGEAREATQSLFPSGKDHSAPRLRFSPHAIETLERAPEVARLVGERTVRPEHILMALYDLPDSGARQVLNALQVTRVELVRVGDASSRWGGTGPTLSGRNDSRRGSRVASELLPELNRVLDLAEEEAIDAGGRPLDVGDVLAVLLTGSEPLGPRITAQLGVTPGDLRAAIDRARRPTL